LASGGSHDREDRGNSGLWHRRTGRYLQSRIVGLSAAIGAWLAPLIAGTAAAMPLRLAAALVAVICFAEAALMLIYARVGKFRHRDRMLAQVPWRGDEHVVDIGTGRGLLLIGAAKRLTTGRATGIDIWNPSDLSDNARYRTMRNLVAEGVADRCDLVDELAQELSLADASADVVLSNLSVALGLPSFVGCGPEP
jgi:arsenite methyltransferase